MQGTLSFISLSNWQHVVISTDRYVQETEWNDQLRVDIREWEMSKSTLLRYPPPLPTNRKIVLDFPS